MMGDEMNTYMCKCGRTFEKNISAATTGCSLENIFKRTYASGHPCYGCPYAKQVARWDRFSQDTPQFVWECRAAKDRVYYGTTCAEGMGPHGGIRIFTLDEEFILSVYSEYARLMGNECLSLEILQNLDGSNGQEIYNFSFPKNKRGEEIRRILLDRFFPSKIKTTKEYRYLREDMSPCEEELQCKERINYYIWRMEKVEEIVKRAYRDSDGRIRFVKEMSKGRYKVHAVDNLDDMDKEDACFAVFGFRSCPTFEEAQIALDLTAQRNQWEEIAMENAEETKPKKCITGWSKYGACSCCGYEGVQCCAACKEDCNSRCGWIDGHSLEAETDNQVVESEEDEEKKEGLTFESGVPVSLRDEVFDEVVSAADSKMNSALRIMLESRSNFDMNIKVSFSFVGNRIFTTYETGYKFEPVNYKTKSVLCDDLDIFLTEDGIPVLSNNRPKQITISDLSQEEPEAHVVADENSVVQEIHFEDGPQEAPDYENESQLPEKLYPGYDDESEV